MTPDHAQQNDDANVAPGLPPIPPKKRDMSQYIRTYAKDVATITHQAPAPAPAAQPEAPVQESVLLPEVDESPVNHPGGSARQFPQETLDLSADDAPDSFNAPMQLPQPSEPLVPAGRPEPSEEDRKSAILARLRGKMMSAPVQQAPAPAPEPEPLPPPMPEPEPLGPPLPPANFDAYRMTRPLEGQAAFGTRAPQDDFASPPPAPEPLGPPLPPANFDAYRMTPALEENFSQMPPPPRPSVPAPEALPVPPTPVPPASEAPGHTYTSDFADHIDDQHASTFQVLAAQQDAQPTAPALKRRDSRSPLLPIFIAGTLILFGAGGLYAAYRLTHAPAAPTETLGVPSLISADEKVELQGPDYAQALADAANQQLVSGNILITYVTDATTTSVGLRNVPQEGGVLIRLLRLGAPDILLRNVDLSSTVGVIAAGTETKPFFILRVNSFQRTFAGMLGWEQRMPEDLGAFYPPYAYVPATDASTTAVTIPGNGQFVDAVVANHDVRVFRDAYGRTLMLYGYFDKQTLVIARNEDAFTAIAARLGATQSP